MTGLDRLSGVWNRRWRWLLLLLLPAMAAAGYMAWWQDSEQGQSIVLIVPDSLDDEQAIYVNAWRDAGAEEGVPVSVMTATAFSQRSAREHARTLGVILPDTIHRRMGDAFTAHVRDYVRTGGRLMLVYDAGALNQRGDYVVPESRFSDMVGLRWMEYERLREDLNRSITLHAAPAVFQSLHIPPGRYRPDEQEGTGRAVLTGYRYDALNYPSLTTRGRFPGTQLLESADGQLAAGVRDFGQGRLLFVNLPLGYLKVRTDGLLMHGMLRYFATELIGLPTLSAVPEGVGGMTLNWHCDARPCEAATRKLIDLGFFTHGPYSFHVTAGPDQRAPGDGLGLDLPNNPAMQAMLKGLLRDGHEIGSHGGWIHDYFGNNVPERPEPAFQRLLDQNKAAVEAVIGRPQTEYSAPQGNQPQWVTDWLSDTGVQSYYITANMGMGPTRTYHEGVRDDTVWSFPVQNYGRVASVEEAFMQRIPEAELGDWLVDMVNFTQAQRVTRLVYFHPPGAMVYPNAVMRMLERATQHEQGDGFRWRTMTELARFLDRRDAARWSWVQDPASPAQLQLRADHDWTLEQLTWEYPQNRYEKPVVVEGEAEIRERDGVWQVVAGDVKRLRVRVRPLVSGLAPATLPH